jgi:hypothetical protein
MPRFIPHAYRSTTCWYSCTILRVSCSCNDAFYDHMYDARRTVDNNGHTGRSDKVKTVIYRNFYRFHGNIVSYYWWYSGVPVLVLFLMFVHSGYELKTKHMVDGGSGKTTFCHQLALSSDHRTSITIHHEGNSGSSSRGSRRCFDFRFRSLHSSHLSIFHGKFPRRKRSSIAIWPSSIMGCRTSVWLTKKILF